MIPQNRFEVLSSRVMKCGVEIERQEGKRKKEEVIQCFKCKKEKHQWKECQKRRQKGKERVVQVVAP